MTKYKFKGEPRGGCPGYFKPCCSEARRGGSYGYDHPGYHLSIHLWEHIGSGEEHAFDELSNLADDENDKGIMEWFKWYLPHCVALVPKRRCGRFLEGFWLAVEEGRVF